MKRGKRNHGNLPTRTRSLRLPIALWERLEAEAARTGESMNGALWRILEASLPTAEDTPNKPLVIKPLVMEVAKIPTNPDHPGKPFTFARAFIVHDEIRQNEDLFKVHMDKGQAACEDQLTQFIRDNKIEAWVSAPVWTETSSEYWKGDKVYKLSAQAIGTGPEIDQIDALTIHNGVADD